MAKLQEIADELQSRGIDAKIIEVSKLNGTKDGIVVREGNSNTGMVIYEEMLNGSISEMADQVMEYQGKFEESAPDTESFMNREFAIEHAMLCVCRQDWNEEMLKDTPHEQVGFSDLEIYPRVDIGDATFRVTDNYLKSVGLTEQEIMDAAKKNGEYAVMSMNDIMAGMMGCEPGDLPETKLVVIGAKQQYAAAGIYRKELLDVARQKLNCEKIYVIPSSIHEVICQPVEFANEESINSIICDVNSEVVAEGERLSDHVYFYDGEILRNAGQEYDIDMEELLS